MECGVIANPIPEGCGTFLTTIGREAPLEQLPSQTACHRGLRGSWVHSSGELLLLSVPQLKVCMNTTKPIA